MNNSLNDRPTLRTEPRVSGRSSNENNSGWRTVSERNIENSSQGRSEERQRTRRSESVAPSRSNGSSGTRSSESRGNSRNAESQTERSIGRR
jgi:hypothetical protein